MAATGFGTCLNFLTGVLIARALGPSGRGELTAILIIPNVTAFLVGLGASQTLSYWLAGHAKRGSGLLYAWLIVMTGVIATSVVGLQPIVPHLLAEQSLATIRIAQIWTLTLGIALYGEVFNGMLLGDQRYLLFNGIRLLPLTISAFMYAVFAIEGQLTLVNALGAIACGGALAVVAGAFLVIRRHPLSAPDWSEARSSIWYGLRVHSNMIGGIANARLDLLILPAFLASGSVGLYSVASNVSWIVVAVAAATSSLVLPQAVRSGIQGPRVVSAAFRMTALVAIALAVFIAMSAAMILHALYGSRFAPSLTPLLLMLPGSVFYACAYVLWAGLGSLHRPGVAALSQVPGLFITIVGLAAFLRSGGLVAAALISTVAYTAVFATALAIYLRVAGLGFFEFFRQPTDGGVVPIAS